MQQRTLHIVFGCLLALTAFTAQAATYKYVDKSGNVVYSATPPADGSSYEKLKGDSSRTGNGEEAAPDSNKTTSSPASGGGSSRDGKDTLKKEVEKNTALRAQNCDGAKKNLEAYTVFRRIQDKDGNVIVLDDNERAKRIEDAKRAVQEFCD
jgi:hypothetical protein